MKHIWANLVTKYIEQESQWRPVVEELLQVLNS